MDRILFRVGEREIFLIIGGDARRRDECDARVRIGDRDELEELIDTSTTFLITPFQLDADAGAGHIIFGVEEAGVARAAAEILQSMWREFLGHLIHRDLGTVGLGVHGRCRDE